MSVTYQASHIKRVRKRVRATKAEVEERREALLAITDEAADDGAAGVLPGLGPRHRRQDRDRIQQGAAGARRPSPRRTPSLRLDRRQRPLAAEAAIVARSGRGYAPDRPVLSQGALGGRGGLCRGLAGKGCALGRRLRVTASSTCR